MSTARLTWVVLDRLVPTEEAAAARAALIARDPELQSLVAQGILSEDEAIEALRSRQRRYGDYEGLLGDRFVLWARRLATLSGVSFVGWVLLQVAR